MREGWRGVGVWGGGDERKMERRKGTMMVVVCNATAVCGLEVETGCVFEVVCTVKTVCVSYHSDEQRRHFTLSGKHHLKRTMV
jgi:hypothetical protein